MNCICNELRKTARFVTEQYDKALAPSGLKLNQYSMLTNLSRLGSAPVTELANKLELDQTSASRGVALLEKMGLIERIKHEDPRVKALRLTALGRKKLESAQPLWQKAQTKARKKMADNDYEQIAQMLQKLREEPF